jgi:hypothetical protein
MNWQYVRDVEPALRSSVVVRTGSPSTIRQHSGSGSGMFYIRLRPKYSHWMWHSAILFDIARAIEQCVPGSVRPS